MKRYHEILMQLNAIVGITAFLLGMWHYNSQLIALSVINLVSYYISWHVINVWYKDQQ